MYTVGPIIVAFISYISNKKYRKDLINELDVRLIEKDKETASEIQKISALLERDKQKTSWEKITDIFKDTLLEHIKKIGYTRYADNSDIPLLVNQIDSLINSTNISSDDLKELLKLLNRINLPLNDDILYASEIMNLFHYKRLKNILNKKYQTCGQKYFEIKVLY